MDLGANDREATKLVRFFPNTALEPTTRCGMLVSWHKLFDAKPSSLDWEGAGW